MIPQSIPEAQSGPRRRIPACVRCRQRKTKCDNKLPICSNCERAGVACDQGVHQDRLRADQLQSRVTYLEDLLKNRTSHLNGRTSNVPPVPGPSDGDNSSFVINAPRGNDANLRPADGDGNGGSADAPVGEGNRLGSIPQDSTLAGRRISTARHSPPRSATEPLAASQSEATTRLYAISTPSTSITESHIGPEQPLAHDVGLLSLGNANSDPKYLGPSSGVTFARLIYAAAPQTQGLPSANYSRSIPRIESKEPVTCAPLPTVAQMHRFVDSYFGAFNHLYPFLKEEQISELIERKHKDALLQQGKGDIDLALLFLVAALGARNLEREININLPSDSLLASAMAEIGQLQLHDSMQGVQVMLLLVLISLWFPQGFNAWYLMATIIASCLDLGLQRKRVTTSPLLAKQSDWSIEDENIRSSIFWSAYSLDRTLATALGRPLTLRDEAIDVEFPGETGTGYSSYPATVIPAPLYDLDFFNVQHQAQPGLNTANSADTGPPPGKRARFDNSFRQDYAPARFSFRFDRINAEIKLMLYRVVQVPSRFPWPTDLGHWQSEAYEACNSLLSAARDVISTRRSSFGHFRRALPAIELKYHQCILLLFRPSPAFRRPSPNALAICHVSASEVIRIHAEQHKFGQLADTWLTGHLVFVSGITMIYTAWVLPSIADRAAFPDSLNNLFSSDLPVTATLRNGITSCSDLLSHLGQTWSVARDAKEKFDTLGSLTLEGLSNGSIPFASGRTANSARGETPNRALSSNTGASEVPGIATVDTTWFGAEDRTDLSDLLDPPDFLNQLGDFSTFYDFDWMAHPTSSF